MHTSGIAGLAECRLWGADSDAKPYPHGNKHRYLYAHSDRYGDSLSNRHSNQYSDCYGYQHANGDTD